MPCLLGVAPAYAETPAGTRVSNTATMTFGPTEARQTLASNAAVLTVAERLDVTIAAATPTLEFAGGGAPVAVPFVLTNAGNGNEPIRVTATLGASGATIAGIAVDTDNNGAYDASVDRAIDTAGVATVPGQQQRVFVLVTGPAANLAVTATATAATGSGAAGTIFAGTGDDGGDAVVGRTGAVAQAQTLLQAGTAAPELVKSQSVLAFDGSTRALRGSVITYSLEARFPAASIAAEVADPIPATTRYFPGSLTIDDQPLSDAVDADAGSFDGSAIHVTLGDSAGPVVRTIRFKTIIQ